MSVLIASGTAGVAGITATQADASTAKKTTMYVTANTPLKATASSKAKTIVTAKKGNVIKITSKTGKYYYKGTIGNKTGWILKSKLSNSKTVKSTVKQTVAYKTVKQNDSTLAKGKTKVVQNGKNGVITKTIQTTYKNGKVSSTKTLSSKTTTKAVNKIVKVGTKVATTPKATTLSKAKATDVVKENKLLTLKNGVWTYTDSANLKTTQITIGNNGVSKMIFRFEKYTYALEANLEEMIKYDGKKDGTEQYKTLQTMKANIDSTAKTGAEAIFGKGTKEAAQLQKEIVKNFNTYKIIDKTKTVKIGGRTIEFYYYGVLLTVTPK